MIRDREADRIDRLRNMRDELARIGPRMPDRSFHTSDWSGGGGGGERYPLLILEYIDGGLDSIYGPYTNTADLMAAYRHLTYMGPGDEWDDGYEYEFRALNGKP